MSKRNMLLTAVGIIVLFAGACYAQLELDSYLRRVINLCLIYAIIGLSMNLTNGFAGQFSLGQAGFMAIGAYVVGIFTVPVELRENVFYAVPMNPLIADIQLPLWLALIVGGILAAAVAWLIGTPVLRLRGDYLAIATLGFSEIIRIVITNAQSFTNGALGIKDIPTINDVRFIFLVTAVIFVFITCLINSSYGRAFKAIREDEIAAEAMGVSLFHHKNMAFMLSAFFAGIGGGLYATLLGTVDPKNFLFTLTYNFLLIIVLGGMGSITGSMLGSIIVTAGLEYLRIFDEPLSLFGTTIPLFRPGFRMVIFSLLLMVCVLFWRKGIMGTEEFTWDKFVAFCKNPFQYFKKGAKHNG
ncbi:MAG: branched-chain amino acid ABC transporter permease [Phascolarctobacterium sp.]|nr:branched-chain amino acid ABC transporter permease [Phascolarctobacterium sp.]